MKFSDKPSPATACLQPHLKSRIATIEAANEPSGKQISTLKCNLLPLMYQVETKLIKAHAILHKAMIHVGMLTKDVISFMPVAALVQLCAAVAIKDAALAKADGAMALAMLAADTGDATVKRTKNFSNTEVKLAKDAQCALYGHDDHRFSLEEAPHHPEDSSGYQQID